MQVDQGKIERILKYLGGMQDRAPNLDLHHYYHRGWTKVYFAAVAPAHTEARAARLEEAHVMAEDAAANHEETKRQLVEGREAEVF